LQFLSRSKKAPHITRGPFVKQRKLAPVMTVMVAAMMDFGVCWNNRTDQDNQRDGRKQKCTHFHCLQFPSQPDSPYIRAVR
jgi:hypothetical protein